MPHKEKQFVFDHSNLFVKESWYQKMDVDGWCKVLGIMNDADSACVTAIRQGVKTVAV
jgi:hypothetical protein